MTSFFVGVPSDLSWEDLEMLPSDDLFQQVYSSLRHLAGQRMARERMHHTLQPTALVNEVYLRLQVRTSGWASESEFFAAAVEGMRRILVEYARARGSQKRGGGRSPISHDVVDLLESQEVDRTLDLEEALTQLEKIDSRACQVVGLRYFAGLSIEETARLLDISPRTVRREWDFARAWLFDRLGEAVNIGDSHSQES